MTQLHSYRSGLRNLLHRLVCCSSRTSHRRRSHGNKVQTLFELIGDLLSRETKPYVLPDSVPDMEVFYLSPMDAIYNMANLDHANEYTRTEPGWYWVCHYSAYGPVGPFDTEEEAGADGMRY
jgi:hypothetical protein